MQADAFKYGKEKNAVEVLLENKGKIVEGVRSNIFGVKDSTLITPDDNEVLQGVTRKHVIAIAKKNKIKIKYEAIDLKKIDKYDELFLTSTSMNIMPIKKIDNHVYRVGEVTKKLQIEYKKFIKNYIG